jgi:flagellar protein FliO/FliZ
MSTLGWYFLKLFVLLPMIGGMIYAALWLYRKYQPGLIGGQQDRLVRIIDALPMGTAGKLAVIEFEGKRVLLAVTRGRIEKVAESDRHG